MAEQEAQDDRYVKTGGKYWGAKFEDLCRDHRLYVLQPNAGANERLDLHTSPDGDMVGPPVDYPECTLCQKAANEHGQGLHGVSARGCPLCGGELERKQSVGRGSVLNYARCPRCVPDPLLTRLVRAVKRLLQPGTHRYESDEDR